MFEEVVERLATAISAVAALDLDQLDDGSLDELVVALQRQRHRLDAGVARPLARWHDRGVWASDGSLTAAGRLARDAHTSTASAAATCDTPPSFVICQPPPRRSRPAG